VVFGEFHIINNEFFMLLQSKIKKKDYLVVVDAV